MQQSIGTPLGQVKFYVNGTCVPVDPTPLPKQNKVFHVDGRYAVTIDTSASKLNDVTVEAVLVSEVSFSSGPDTGENLAQICFDYESERMSIGFQGDIDAVQYEYLYDRMRIYLPKGVSVPEMKCYIAWLEFTDKENQLSFTWFAAIQL